MKSWAFNPSRNGRIYENIVGHWLQKYGLVVSTNHDVNDHGPDILVFGFDPSQATLYLDDPPQTRVTIDKPISIEVKGSSYHRINEHGCGFQFNLYRKNMSIPLSEDFTILVCVEPNAATMFVIPTHYIKKKHSISLYCRRGHDYAGKYAIYRYNVGGLINAVRLRASPREIASDANRRQND